MIRYLVRGFKNNKCVHYLSIRLSICMPVRKPVFPSKQLFVYHLFDCLLGRIFIRLSNCPTVNLLLFCMLAWQHLSLSVCSFALLFLSFFIRLSDFPSVRLLCYLTVHLLANLSVCMFVRYTLFSVICRLCTNVLYSYLVHVVWLSKAKKKDIECLYVFLIIS